MSITHKKFDEKQKVLDNFRDETWENTNGPTFSDSKHIHKPPGGESIAKVFNIPEQVSYHICS